MTARMTLRERMRLALTEAGVDLDALGGRVISIDPGPKLNFWALFDGGDLEATGKTRAGEEMDEGEVSLALIETPVGWPVRSPDGGMSLLPTAVEVGRLSEHWVCRGARVFLVGSTAWRSVLFGRTNPSDREVKLYVEGVVDMKANRKIQLNNAHVRDAVGMFLAARVLAREGRLL